MKFCPIAGQQIKRCVDCGICEQKETKGSIEMDREKVIKGLECLIQMTSCVGCPYLDSGKTREECLSYIGKDTLALLKEQDEEVRNAYERGMETGRKIKW